MLVVPVLDEDVHGSKPWAWLGPVSLHSKCRSGSEALKLSSWSRETDVLSGFSMIVGVGTAAASFGESVRGASVLGASLVGGAVVGSLAPGSVPSSAATAEAVSVRVLSASANASSSLRTRSRAPMEQPLGHA